MRCQRVGYFLSRYGPNYLVTTSRVYYPGFSGFLVRPSAYLQACGPSRRSTLRNEFGVKGFTLSDLGAKAFAPALRLCVIQAVASVTDPPTAEPRSAANALTTSVFIANSSLRTRIHEHNLDRRRPLSRAKQGWCGSMSKWPRLAWVASRLQRVGPSGGGA